MHRATLLAADAVDQAGQVVAEVQHRSDDLIAQVEAWLVRALVADARRQDYGAVEALQQALVLAEPEGIRHPFASFPPDRLIRLADRARGLGALDTPFGRSVLDLWRPDRPDLDLPVADPLTDREHLVLAYLPTMLSNTEIADQMFVSVNTVKAHLKSLYRKLGVASRRAAVARGRALGVIPSGRGDEPEVPAEPNGLVSSADRQLPKDVADVRPDGVDGDEQPGGNLLGRRQL